MNSTQTRWIYPILPWLFLPGEFFATIPGSCSLFNGTRPLNTLSVLPVSCCEHPMHSPGWKYPQPQGSQELLSVAKHMP